MRTSNTWNVWFNSWVWVAATCPHSTWRRRRSRRAWSHSRTMIIWLCGYVYITHDLIWFFLLAFVIQKIRNCVFLWTRPVLIMPRPAWCTFPWTGMLRLVWTAIHCNSSQTSRLVMMTYPSSDWSSSRTSSVLVTECVKQIRIGWPVIRVEPFLPALQREWVGHVKRLCMSCPTAKSMQPLPKYRVHMIQLAAGSPWNLRGASQQVLGTWEAPQWYEL